MIPDYIEPILAWRVWRTEYEWRGLPETLAARSVFLDKNSKTEKALYLRSVSAWDRWPFKQPLKMRQSSRLNYAGIHASKKLKYFERGQKFGYITQEFYSFREMEKMEKDWTYSFESPIIGLVKLWGKIIEGEFGYRAEYAYPHHIFIPRYSNTERVANQLSSNYDVPCDILGPKLFERKHNIPFREIWNYLNPNAKWHEKLFMSIDF